MSRLASFSVAESSAEAIVGRRSLCVRRKSAGRVRESDEQWEEYGGEEGGGCVQRNGVCDMS